jgi:hypothetical protein
MKKKFVILLILLIPFQIFGNECDCTMCVNWDCSGDMIHFHYSSSGGCSDRNAIDWSSGYAFYSELRPNGTMTVHFLADTSPEWCF